MNAQYSSQSGMVLVTSLVILMILTMLGLSSVQGTSIQELIARNQRDSNLAFNAAETAIIEAEALLNAITSISYDSDDPLVIDSTDGGSIFADASVADPWTSGSENTASDGRAKYIVEHISTVVSDEDRLNLDNIGQNPNACCTQMFRIRAKGLGGTDDAQVIIEAAYGKRF